MRKLSARLFVKRVDCHKTEERSVQIFITYERTFSSVFWEEEWLVGANPFNWNFGSLQTGYSDEKAVCPSVCQTHALWQNGRKICPDFYTLRKIN